MSGPGEAVTIAAAARRRGRKPPPARPIGWCIAPTCRQRWLPRFNDTPDIRIAARMSVRIRPPCKGTTVVQRPLANAPAGTGAGAGRRTTAIWSTVRNHLF